MKRATRILRWLVVSEWCLLVVAIAADYALESTLPEPLFQYVKNQDSVSLTQAQTAISLGLLGLWVASTIGIFRLWRAARLLYVASTLVATVTMPLDGPEVRAAWAVPINELMLMLSGLVIGLLYFSEASHHFERPRESDRLGPDPIR